MRLALLLAAVLSLAGAPYSALAACPPVPGGCPKNRPPTSPPTFAPVACTNQGTCINGACACNAGFIGMDCSVPARTLVLGDFVLTEEALRDAPNRYSTVIVDAFSSAKASFTGLGAYAENECSNYILQTSSLPASAINISLDQTSVSFDIVSSGIVMGAVFQIAVPSVPLDVYVSSVPGNSGCCPGGIATYATSAMCVAACQHSSGDHISMAFNVTLTARAEPVVWPNGSVSITVVNSTIHSTFIPTNLGLQTSCNLNAYTALLFNLVNNYVSPFGVAIEQQLQAALVGQVQALATSLVVPKSFALTDVLSVVYQVSDIKITSGKLIVVSAQGNLLKKRWASSLCPVVYSSFVDTSADRLFGVPTDWESSPGLAENDQGNILALTAGARLSRSLLNGFVWSWFLDDPSAVRAITYANQSVSVLDANFMLWATWDFPSFGFLPNNDVSIQIDAGTAQLLCVNLNLPMVSAQFGLLSFIAKLDLYINSSGYYQLAPQLLSADGSNINLNLTLPQFPVPNALVGEVLGSLMSQYMPTMNAFLKSDAVTLPSSLLYFLPSPRVEPFQTLTQGPDGRSGFLQLSSHCLCGGPYGQTNAITTRFGVEEIVSCSKACPATVISSAKPSSSAGRRRLEDDKRHRPAVPIPSHNAHPVRRRRSLNGVSIDDPACVAQNYTVLARATPVILNCMTQTGLAGSFSPAAVRWDCMRQGVLAAWPSGGCDQNGPFAAVRDCQATLSDVFQVTYGTTCVNDFGGVSLLYSCDDLFSTVFDEVCFCEASSRLVCQEYTLPFYLVGAGVALPPVFTFGMIVFVRLFASSSYRDAFFARSTWRKRDKLITVVFFASTFCMCVMAFVWIFDDPFRNWVNLILNQSIMKSNWVDSSSLSNVMISWSMTGLFAVSCSASSMTVALFWSLWIGKVLWLHPNSRLFLRNGNIVVLEPEEFRFHLRVSRLWSWFLRFQIMFIICILFAPPLFYSFITSVTIVAPIYVQEAFNSSVAANLTSTNSLFSSQGVLNEMTYVLGLSILAQAMGFLSSGFLFMMHGTAPGIILAAQTVMLLVANREEAEKKEYSRYEGILPPPDDSEMVNIKRVMLLFQWSIHLVAGISTMVPVILLYQTLNAPVAWALAWMLCWMLPVPLLFIIGSKTMMELIPRARTVVMFLYGIFFGTFTLIMVILNPPAAGFSVYFAGTTIAVAVTITYLTTLSELINVDSRATLALAPRTRSMRMKKMRLLQHMGIDVVNSPHLIDQDLNLAMWSPSSSQRAMLSSPGMSTSKRNNGALASPPPLDLNSANPMFRSPQHSAAPLETESGGAAPVRPPRTRRVEQAYQRALITEDVGVDAMAIAAKRIADRAAARVRASMVAQPVTTSTTSAAPVVPPRNYDRRVLDSLSIDASPAGSGKVVSANAPQAIAANRARLQRDIEKRLAARGVKGEAAQQLVSRIADYELARSTAMQASTRVNEFKPVRPARRDLMGPSAARPPQGAVTPAPEAVQQPATASEFNALRAAASPSGTTGRQQHKAHPPPPLPRPAVATPQRPPTSPQAYKAQTASATVKQSGRVGDVESNDAVPSAQRRRQLQAERLVKDLQEHGLTEYTYNRILSSIVSNMQAIRPFYAVFYDWIWELRENKDPRMYGLRYPWRRQIFFAGVLLAFIVHIHASQYEATVQNLKQEIFVDLFGNSLSIPSDSNISNVLDLALAQYAYEYNLSSRLEWVVLFLLLISFLAEIFYSRFAMDDNKKFGLIISRLLLFLSLPFVFAVVILTPSPNYFIDIQNGVKNIPQCAPELDATVNSLVSQALGLCMGVYLTGQLFFVLLLAVPSLMHGAYFITWREVRRIKVLNLAEPREEFEVSSKRAANSRLVFRLYPWLNPTLTFIPCVLIAQFLSNKLYVPLLILVFWAWPAVMAQWGRNSQTQKIIFWFYFFFWLLFMFTYFLPLLVIVLIEGQRLGQVGYLISVSLLNPYWYMNSLAESCLIVIVVCDVLYLFLANNDKDVGDLLIDDYLKAVRNEAQFEANIPLLNSEWPSMPSMSVTANKRNPSTPSMSSEPSSIQSRNQATVSPSSPPPPTYRTQQRQAPVNTPFVDV